MDEQNVYNQCNIGDLYLIQRGVNHLPKHKVGYIQKDNYNTDRIAYICYQKTHSKLVP